MNCNSYPSPPWLTWRWPDAKKGHHSENPCHITLLHYSIAITSTRRAQKVGILWVNDAWKANEDNPSR